MKRAAGLLFVLALALRAWAQQPAPAGENPQQPPALPSDPLKPGEKPELPILSDELPLLRDELPLTPAGAATKPPESARYRLQLALDAVQPILPPLPATGLSLASTVRITVRQFVFEGNHVFSDRQLAKVVAPYTGRVITTEELEEARVALTKHYVEAGYITSGAVLPDQDVQGGIVKVQIVEGRLSEIELRGQKWFRSWWLRNELRRAAGQPLNFTQLKQGIQLLRQNPSISQINAEVKPGVKPGESILEIAVKDEQPFHAGFEVSNKRPPSVSEGLGELYLTDVNLTGHNDPLDLRWGFLRWSKDGAVDFADTDNLSASYEFPITPWGTTLGAHAAKSDASIIDETFAELGITSRYEEYGASIRQPLYRTLTDTVSIALSADRKHSETFLLGQPFTLATGALNGESDTFATRLALDWVNRSQRHVLALRTVFSLGLYALGSTRDDPRSASAISGGDPLRGFDPEIPDSKFFSWLGQAQYVLRVFDTAAMRKKPDTRLRNLLRETLVVVRVNAQLSDEPLLSLEQFSIGGVQSVRGYRENQLLRDNGVFASAELRIPLWLAKDKSPIVSLAPFFDFAAGWNINKVDDQYETVYSAGVGLLVNATRHAQMTLYWGHPFVDFDQPKASLQDYGLHFAVTINAF
jgi:hemolysin activation/secretion protein